MIILKTTVLTNFFSRTTILPQKEMIKDMLGRLKEFHLKFMAEYQ